MDTSETYIKMCEKATEIQKVCPFSEGDFIFNKSAYPVGRLFVNYAHQPYEDRIDWELIYKPDEYKRFNIWLPRQDQLQEMIGEKSMGGLIHRFHQWYHSHLSVVTIKENETYFFMMSMEQLWLALAMFELYKKSWNGTDWVKE